MCVCVDGWIRAWEHACEKLNPISPTNPATPQIALPQGVLLTKGKFKPFIPNPAPVLAGGNATWLGIPLKPMTKSRVKVMVDASGYTSTTPLVLQARVFRHDGTAPVPCEGSSVESQS